MKITNFDLIQINNVLDESGKKKLPQRINFAIIKNLKILKEDLETYQESLQSLFKSYDEWMIKDENGQPKMDAQGIPEVEESHRTEFQTELIDLLNLQIDVDLYQLDDDVFNYEDNDRYDALSAQEIMTLQRIICKEEKKEEEE